MHRSYRAKIGEILGRRGQAQSEQIDFLLEVQSAYRNHGKHLLLGELLVEHRAVTNLTLTEALAAQEAMPDETPTQIVEAMEEA